MKNKIAAALKAASDRHIAAKAALEKITAVVSAKALPAIDENAVARARHYLEDCLARRALDEAADAEVDQARRNLEKEEAELADFRKKYAAQHEAAQLESSGLGRRFSQAQAEIRESQDALEEAEVAWLKEELRLADETYTNFALEVRDSYLKVMAVWQILYRRNIPVANSTAVSQELSIPSIGPKSSEAAANPQDGRGGVAGYIFKEKRNYGGEDYLSAVKADLEAAAAGERGKVERIVRSVSDVVSGAVAETVSRFSGR